MIDGTNDNGHTAADLVQIDTLRKEICDRASELITLLGGLASADLTLIPSMVERECDRVTGRTLHDLTLRNTSADWQPHYGVDL